MSAADDFVTSADGTRIGFRRLGDGAPIVLVHGALSDHVDTWGRVIPLLAQRFTVYAMDRRGRGMSGDPAPHTIEDEAADIAAVIDTAGGRAHVVAHSWGAHCSLRAATLDDNIDRLVAYEPPPPPEHRGPEGEAKVRDAIERGDWERFLQLFLLVPRDALPKVKRSPRWERMLELAPATAEDLLAFWRDGFDPGRYAAVEAPTLLMAGGDSSSMYRGLVDELAGHLPDVRVETLPGQDHFGMVGDPDGFTAAVARFLLGER